MPGRARARSGPKPRPWLGLYTRETDSGLVVAGVSPIGPARSAGFRPGDRIVRVNGEEVSSQADGLMSVCSFPEHLEAFPVQ